MIDNFLNYIEAESLIKKNDKVLLAVSGGIDSVVLSHFFHQTSFNFGIAHCNFQLRGKESDDDETFVKLLAKKLNKPFFCKHFNTNKYANERGISTQMAARDLRYSWFSDLLKSEGYSKIATAHHLNDSIETTLFNFSKGTGISGVRGIMPISNVLIRPLLSISRLQIEQFAKEQNIEWREDSSNKKDKYARNHIRLTVIPELKKINESLESTSISTFERLRDVENIFKNEVEKFRNEFVKKENNLTTITIGRASNIIGFRTILHEILKDFGFNFNQTKEIIKRKNESGKFFLSPIYQLNIDRDKFIISENKEIDPNIEFEINRGDKSITFPYGHLDFDWDKLRPASFSRDNNIAYLDVDKLKFPLKLRKWKTGDFFQPLGMKHKKKLSDFMIDRKIPLNLKEQVMVIESADKIVWVVGHQPDDRFKLTDHTSEICCLEFTS
ncbi:MAG: tRNA lysidine(34) synthetase TilS [Cyclobacteriaceae bacterium]|nr:tRNA lysidine(34) synthetase TilS [Cyclobacteriaceae bacterium]